MLTHCQKHLLIEKFIIIHSINPWSLTINFKLKRKKKHSIERIIKAFANPIKFAIWIYDEFHFMHLWHRILHMGGYVTFTGGLKKSKNNQHCLKWKIALFSIFYMLLPTWSSMIYGISFFKKTKKSSSETKLKMNLFKIVQTIESIMKSFHE